MCTTYIEKVCHSKELIAGMQMEKEAPGLLDIKKETGIVSSTTPRARVLKWPRQRDGRENR